MKRTLCLGLALAALAVPGSALADDLAPPLRYPPTSVRTPIFVGAAIVFGVGYGGVAIGAAAAPEWPGSEELYIPFAGPFMSLANLRCPDADPKCDPGFLVLRGSLITASALAQLGGLALLIQGIALKTEAAPKKKEPTKVFGITPFVAPAQAGAGGVGGVIGRF